MADTLNALGALDVADPRRDRTSSDREALVGASTRCLGADTSTRVEVAGAHSIREPVRDLEPESDLFSGESDSGDVFDSNADRRSEAIERLTLLGRSEADATCIVDRLLEVFADDVFDSPNFGVGRDSFEAHAFTLCATETR